MFLVLFMILDTCYIVFQDLVDFVWGLWSIFGIHMLFWAHISREMEEIGKRMGSRGSDQKNVMKESIKVRMKGRGLKWGATDLGSA